MDTEEIWGNEMREKNKKYHFLYIIMIGVFAFMVIWSYSHYTGPSIIDECFTDKMEFSEGWLDADGNDANIAKLRDLEGTEIYEEFSVFHDIPEDLAEGQYLCFRSKNIFFKMYIDGELVYEQYVLQCKMYTKSAGTRWNYVPIKLEDAGKQIEFRITKVYESGRSSIDNIYLGEPAKAIMDTVGEKLVAFITCILLLFVGLILIIADIPINMSTRKNHELLYLGLFSMSIATWCLAETHLLQLYLGDSRMMQLVSCCSLMMICIPMILYLEAAFGFRHRNVVTIMVWSSFLEFILCMVLHFTGIADVHETLHFSHVVLAACAIVLFYTIIRDSFSKGKNKTKNIYRMLRGIGLSTLSIATGIDIYRYYTSNSSDTAMFVRIGLLIFIICFGSSSLEKTINAVKLGVQTEFVSQLAYKDGLTGIGNRTAFEEHLIDLEKIKDDIVTIGIIMFDVNDLKYVNDNLGHQMGDKLLVASATLIQDAFKQLGGDCFRIGGDEFVVLMSGNDVESRCECGIEAFQKDMETYNTQPDKELRISIATGTAYYDYNQKGKKLMDIYQQADAQMYENKKRIKAGQIKPEEYYKNRLKKA